MEGWAVTVAREETVMVEMAEVSEAAVVKVEEAMDRAVGEGVVVRVVGKEKVAVEEKEEMVVVTKVEEVEREEVVEFEADRLAILVGT